VALSLSLSLCLAQQAHLYAYVVSCQQREVEIWDLWITYVHVFAMTAETSNAWRSLEMNDLPDPDEMSPCVHFSFPSYNLTADSCLPVLTVSLEIRRRMMSRLFISDSLS
jgi:hypothetical protein